MSTGPSAASVEAAARAAHMLTDSGTPPRTPGHNGSGSSPRRLAATAHLSPPNMMHEMLVPIRLLGVRVGWKFRDPKLERAYAYRTLCDMWLVQVLMLIFLILFRIARVVSIIIAGFSALAVFILSVFVIVNYLILLAALIAFKALKLDKATQAATSSAAGAPRQRDSDSSPLESVLLLGESPLDAESLESPELSANLPAPTPSDAQQRLLGVTPSAHEGQGAAPAGASPPTDVPRTPAPSSASSQASNGHSDVTIPAMPSSTSLDAFQVAARPRELQRRPPVRHSKLAAFLLWYMTHSLYFSIHWGVTIMLAIATQFLADWTTCGTGPETSGVTCFAYSHAIFPVIPVTTVVMLMFFTAIVVTYGPVSLLTIVGLITILAIQWATLFTATDPLVPEVSSLVVDIVQVTLLTATCFIFAIALNVSIDTSRRKRLVYLAAVNAQFSRYRLEVARTAAFEAELNRLREEEVVASTASAVQEMTIGYASHQLRNPLHAAKVLLSELEEATTLSPRSRGNFAELGRAIDQLKRITDDVLQHQRLLGGTAAVRPSRTLIRELLSTVVQSYANTSGRPIMLAVEDDVPTTVSIDGLRLMQALSNGLSNAVAALPWWATTGNRIMVLVRVMGAPPLVSTMRRPAVVVEGRDKLSPALAWIEELGASGVQLVVPNPGRGSEGGQGHGAAPASGAAPPVTASTARPRSQPAIATYNPAYQARLCDAGWSKLVERATALAKLQRHRARVARATSLATGQADPLVLLLHHIRNSITSQATLTVRHLGPPVGAGSASARVVPEAGEVIFEPRVTADEGNGSEDDAASVISVAALTALPTQAPATVIGETPSMASEAGAGVSMPLPEPSQPPGPGSEAPRWQWWLRVEVVNETQGRTPLAGKNVAELFNPFSLGGPIHDASAARIAHTGLGLPICTLLAASLSGRTGLFDDTAFPADLFEEEAHPRWAQLSAGGSTAPTPYLGGLSGAPTSNSAGQPSTQPAPSPTLSLQSLVTEASPLPGPSPTAAPSNPSEAPSSPAPARESSGGTAWGRSLDAQEPVPRVQPLQPDGLSGQTTMVTRFFFAVPLQLPLVTASADELLEAADWFDPAPLTGIDVFSNPGLGEGLNLPLGITNPVSRHWVAPRKAGAPPSGPAYRQWHRGHRKGVSGGSSGPLSAATRVDSAKSSLGAVPTTAPATPATVEGAREPAAAEGGQPSRSPLALPPAVAHPPPAAGTGVSTAPAGGPPPPVAASTVATPASRALAAPGGHRFRALVVDDEETNRRINARLMSRLGAEVETGRDGDEVPALWEAATAAGHDPPFDVVCLDVIMRRVHGTECAQWLRREKGYRGPILAATGNATEADQRAYRDMGFTDVLVKPFSLQDLRASLRDCGVLPHA